MPLQNIPPVRAWRPGPACCCSPARLPAVGVAPAGLPSVPPSAAWIKPTRKSLPSLMLGCLPEKLASRVSFFWFLCCFWFKCDVFGKAGSWRFQWHCGTGFSGVGMWHWGRDQSKELRSWLFTSCVALEKWLNLFDVSFFLCKIAVPILRPWYDD